MHEDLIRHFLKATEESRSQSQSFNTVILYDIENLTRGNNNPQFNFSLEDISEKIKRYNLVDKIAGQYAYADWSNNKLKTIKPNIQELGIEPIQIFGFSNHKNAADIQLVIDAVELIHSKPSLQVFAIVSGDGGFSCLAKKLHEYGKVVIGCGYENQTNNVFAAVCDYFIRLPASVEQNPNKTNNCTETTAIKPQANKKDNLCRPNSACLASNCMGRGLIHNLRPIKSNRPKSPEVSCAITSSGMLRLATALKWSGSSLATSKAPSSTWLTPCRPGAAPGATLITMATWMPWWAPVPSRPGATN